MKNFDLWDDKPNLIAEKRKEWFKGLPNLFKSNSKKFWSSFKSSTRQSSIPSEMIWTRSVVDSIKADKPADIANLFNNYFYTVYKPPCPASVDEELLPSNQLNSHLQHICQLHLSPGEVFDVLHHLGVSKATGPDKILAKLLKNCAPCISSSLCAIFNKILYLGNLPAAWNVAFLGRFLITDLFLCCLSFQGYGTLCIHLWPVLQATAWFSKREINHLTAFWSLDRNWWDAE